MHNKYLKYKRKYVTLKNKIGGDGINDIKWNRLLRNVVNEFFNISGNNWRDYGIFKENIKIIDFTQSLIIRTQNTNQLNGKIVMCSINDHFLIIIEMMLDIIHSLNHIRIYKIREIHLKNPDERIQDNARNDHDDEIYIANREIEGGMYTLGEKLRRVEDLLGNNYNNIDYNNVVYNNDVNIPKLTIKLDIDNHYNIYIEIIKACKDFLGDLDIAIPLPVERLVELMEVFHENHDQKLNILQKNRNLSETTILMFYLMNSVLELVDILERMRQDYQNRFSVMSADDVNIARDNIDRVITIYEIDNNIRERKRNFILLFNRFKDLIRQL
jgi:hypothetical protein